MTAEPGSTLIVDFVGDSHRLLPGQQLTFGRLADIEIDSNRHLHRVMGCFYSDAGLWWIRNEGGSLPLHLTDHDSRSNATITPGRALALTFGGASLRFSAGGCDYELELDVEETTGSVPVVAAPDGNTTITIGPGSVVLTDDQKLALVVMAENQILDPHFSGALPSNAEMANRIGWTLRRFNRKIDNLCEKFDKLGVRGLRGSVDQLATDRRRRLVDHCVQTGILVESDLSVLARESTQEQV